MLEGLKPVTICDQFVSFLPGQPKNEVGWESSGIPLDSLVQHLGRHPVKLGQVTIEENLLPP